MKAIYILVLIFALSCHISCDESLREAQIKQEEIDGFMERITSYLQKKPWFSVDTPIGLKWIAYLMHHCDVPRTYFEDMEKELEREQSESKVDVLLSLTTFCVLSHRKFLGRNELLPMCPPNKPGKTSTVASKAKSCHCACPKTTDERVDRFTRKWINPFSNLSVISIPWNLTKRIQQTLSNYQLNMKIETQIEQSVDEVIKSYLISILLPEYRKNPIGATNMYAYFQRKCSRNMPTFDRMRFSTAMNIEMTSVVDLHSCISDNWDRDDYQEDVCQVEPAAPCNCVCPALAEAETRVVIDANTLGPHMTQSVIDIATKAYELSTNKAQLKSYLASKMSSEFRGEWGCAILDDLSGLQTVIHGSAIHFLIQQVGKESATILLYQIKVISKVEFWI